MNQLAMSINWLINQYRGKFTAPKGDFGIEIECEGVNLPNMQGYKYWIVHNDHSLRGEAFEYVLAAPLSMNEARTALHHLHNKLLMPPTVIRESPRTSVHIHRNVNSFLIQEVLTFIALYFVIEEFMVRFSGEDRKGNMYCLRCSDAEYLALKLVRSLSSETYFAHLHDDDIRYSSLNIKPVLGFGSLEFRSFRGTIDPEIIYQWITVIENLFESSKKFNSPLDVVKHFENLPADKFLSMVFDTSPFFLKFIFVQPDWSEYMQKGYLYAFEIAYALRGKNKWLNIAEAKKNKKEEEVKPKSKNYPNSNLVWDAGLAAVGQQINEVFPNQVPIPEFGDPVAQAVPRARRPRHQIIEEFREINDPDVEGVIR